MLFYFELKEFASVKTLLQHSINPSVFIKYRKTCPAVWAIRKVYTKAHINQSMTIEKSMIHSYHFISHPTKYPIF